MANLSDYLPLASGSPWEPVDDGIAYNDGKVGVGLNNPQSGLHVSSISAYGWDYAGIFQANNPQTISLRAQANATSAATSVFEAEVLSGSASATAITIKNAGTGRAIYSDKGDAVFENGNVTVAGGFNAAQSGAGVDAFAAGTGAGATDQGEVSVAVGKNAAQTNQGSYAVAVGNSAGRQNQSQYAVAVGVNAGLIDQGYVGTAMGYAAGQSNQKDYGLAMGYSAGRDNQGNYSVALGTNAAPTNQASNGIVINSSGVEVNSTTVGHIIIKSSTQDLRSIPTGGFAMNGDPIVGAQRLISTLSTLRKATMDETTLEGMRDALANAISGLIENLEQEILSEETE
jgi:hypothetical protein